MMTRRLLAAALALLAASPLMASATALDVAAAGSAGLPAAAGALSGLPPAALPVAPPTQAGAGASGSADATGLGKIKHIVIIMQENRSFDHYFGTYPGADGIPMKANGKPKVCVPNPDGGPCVRPYHDSGSVDSGGPHHQADAKFDMAGGQMNGFLQRAVAKGYGGFCVQLGDARCEPGTHLPDVMGYKTAADIPNYWTYAKQFVLQDHMFEPVRSWSLPAHLFLVSGWSARCSNPNDPMSCTTQTANPAHVDYGLHAPMYAWTDITWLLHRANLSWRYYVGNGTPADCGDGRGICQTETNVWGKKTVSVTPQIWSPLPYFTTVRKNNQVGDVQHAANFYHDLKHGKMAAVTWIMPDRQHSEHAPAGTIDQGQAWVTKAVNAIMKSKQWDSTAIFLSWDDWGGFYDHMVPPRIDNMGYGLRVPGLVISPYAKQGYIDHQVLSFDAYLKFIEDVFLGGQRLDPATDGRPDSRPVVRENASILGDLANDFDFTQAPRKPVLLPEFP